MNVPLRIALVTTQTHWHGGEQQASLLVEGLRRRGHDCRILSRHESLFATRMMDRGFEVETFVGRGRLPNSMWRVRRVLGDWRPDVIYMNDPHAVTTAGLASLGLGVPARIAVRRVDFPVRNAAKYQRLCDTVVCISTAVRNACIASGLHPQLLSVVPDGVDPERMQHADRARARRSLGLDAETKLFLTVARLADHKGHRFLLDALPPVVQQNPNAVFAFAGDGQLWEPLRVQTERLGLNRNVLFLGYRDDIPDLLAAADVMVVPSHLEGLCSSIIDAMMLGLPVVATTAGGIPDLLGPLDDQPRCGWLVRPRDPSALASGILNILRYPHLTRQYVHSAQIRAMQEFTADQMVERTLGLFQASLTNWRALRLAG